MTPPRASKKKPAPPNRHDTNRRIEVLRRGTVTPASDPEDLDAPIDSDVHVEASGHGAHLEIRIDGQPASWLGVQDIPQCYGEATLRMGGIGGVRTHDDFRFRGLSRRLMQNVLRWMRAEGYHVSLLFGIPAFYPKFGYVTAFPDAEATMAVRDAERVESSGRYTMVDYDGDRHWEAVLRLYHETNRRAIGPARRVPPRWTREHRDPGRWVQVRVAEDAKGRAVGYFARARGNWTARFLEIGHSEPNAFPDMLADMARIAWDERVERFSMQFPEDSAFLRFCEPLGLTKTLTWHADGETMVRMIDIPAALGAVRPELARRAAGMEPGALTLRTNLDAVGLEWDGGDFRVTKPQRRGAVARMPQWAFARMLYGCRDASTQSIDGVVQASAATVAILDRLFPAGPHSYYRADRF